MDRICVGRVVGGGLAAGLVINVSEFLVNGLWLATDWEAAMRALGKTPASMPMQIVVYNLFGFILGLLAVWFYAAIRPRFGPGPKTAVIAALAVWIPGYLLSLVPPLVMDMFPAHLMLIGLVVGLVEMLIGTQLGAYLYREESSPAAAV